MKFSNSAVLFLLFSFWLSLAAAEGNGADSEEDDEGLPYGSPGRSNGIRVRNARRERSDWGPGNRGARNGRGGGNRWGGGRRRGGSGSMGRTRPNEGVQSEVDNITTDSNIAANAAAFSGVSAMGDGSVIIGIQALAAALKVQSGAIDAFEEDMVLLSSAVNNTAVEAATFVSTVTTHYLALETIRSAVTTLQDEYFAVVTKIESVITAANTEISGIQGYLSVEADDPMRLDYLETIVGLQQEAANLESAKEELETLIDTLAIQVDNLDDFDDILAFFIALAGDAGVSEQEECIYDPYGDCTFTNGFCYDGYEFFSEKLTKTKEIPLSGIPSSITVSTLSTCGFRFDNDGFDIELNNVAVATIYEGNHCVCDPPLGTVTISNFTGVITGEHTSVELKITARGTSGYIAEAFAEIEYGSMSA